MKIRVYVRSEKRKSGHTVATLHPTMTEATEGLRPTLLPEQFWSEFDTIVTVEMKTIEVNEFEPVE